MRKNNDCERAYCSALQTNGPDRPIITVSYEAYLCLARMYSKDVTNVE